MNAIDVTNLSKSYDGKQNALDDVSFSIPQGEIFGFLGPNGSGKTTTVRLLNGILKETGGSAKVLGLDISKEQVAIHKICGVMTETAMMYENLTGIENLMFFGHMHNMTEYVMKKRSNELLKTLELEDAANKNVKAYSTGMKKRLSLARALIHSPKILFLDEPTSGLDPESALNVTRLIRQLAKEQGITIFLCTHQLKYAEEICTLYGFIHNGKMLGFGTFEELLKQRNSTKFLEIRDENGTSNTPIHSDEEVSELLYKKLSKGEKVYEAKQISWSLEDLYFSFEEGIKK